MAGCNWCGTTEVKLAENKPYCPDCASNCKRECTVCHKLYPNLKFYEKHSKRCNSCQSRYIVAKTKKASIENNRRKFGDTTGKRKQYDSDEESASSGEEKEEEEEEEEAEEEEEEEYEVEGESTKKEDCSKNEVFSKTTKNVQKASTTPPSKRQLTVMETLQINKMKRDKEAGDKKKKRKRGKNTAEVTAEKSQFLQQVAEYVSKKRGRGQLIVNF